MQHLAGVLATLWACAAAQGTPTLRTEDAAVARPTLLTTADAVPALDGQRVTVLGTYTEVDVSRRHPRDTRPPRLLGHVAVVLSDGRKVYLEPSWSPEALRSEEERAAWRDKPVRVTGTLHARMPEPEVPVASLTAPCLSPVVSLEPK